MARSSRTPRRDSITVSRRLILRGHDGIVRTLAYSPDGRDLLSASDDGTARVWNAKTGRNRAILAGHRDSLRGAEFSPDGRKILTVSCDHTARIWNAVTFQRLKHLEGHSDELTAGHFSPTGTRVATASWDGKALIWDAETGGLMTVLRDHKGWVSGVAFAPDESCVATASVDGTGRIWSCKGRPLAVLHGHATELRALIFTADGTELVTVSGGEDYPIDNTVRTWDVRTGLQTRHLKGHRDQVMTAAICRTGETILTASMDHTAVLWQRATATIRAKLSHRAPVTCAKFSPDARIVATGSWDKSVRLWSAQTGQALSVPLIHPDYVWQLTFNPSGTEIATACSDGMIRIWALGVQTGP